MSALFLIAACDSSSDGPRFPGFLVPGAIGGLVAGNDVGGCPVDWPFQNENGESQGAFLADSSVRPEITGEAFGDPLKAANGICGGGWNNGSLDVYSTAKSMHCDTNEDCVVLEWTDSKVINTTGIDFVVYENGFAYGNGMSRFMEPVIVEVSNDLNSWCGWKPEYTGVTDLNDPEFLKDVRNSENFSDLAGITPVLFKQNPDAKNTWKAEDLFTTTTDSRGTYLKAGGDGFDLDSPEFGQTGIGCSSELADQIKINGFRYVRLTTAYTRDSQTFPLAPDSFDRRADIDGVIAKSTEAL